MTAVLGGIAGASIVTGWTSWLPFGVASRIALALPAFVFSAAFSSWCASARSADRVPWRALGGGAFTAASLSGLYLPLLFWLNEGNGNYDRLCLYWGYGVVASLFLVAPLGAVFSFLYLPMLLPAREARSHPSLGAADHMLVRGGIWLGLLGLAGAGLAGIGIVDMPNVRGPHLGLGISIFALVCGLVAIAMGLKSGARRKQWLAEVRAGVVPGFRIVPLEKTETELLPLVHGDDARDGALVRVARVDEVSYREAAVVIPDEPLALVRL